MSAAGGKNGNYTRQRGYRAEAEWCKKLTQAGVPTKRHLMSGMFEKGDCTTTPPAGEKLLGQVKRKKAVPAWLELDAHDYTATREDNGEWFVVIRASTFIKLCGGSNDAA